YEFGMLNGIQKKYQSNKLMQSLPYTYDNKNGNFVYYNTFGKINTQESFESESYLDTNWYKPPVKNWAIVANEGSETHQKHLWFYPPLPGMEIVKTYKGLMGKEEGLFKIRRAVAYDYWPELIPAKFVGGNIVEKDYIRKNLTIPKKSLDKHVNGKVLVRYKIDHLGLISDIVVLKSIGFGLDEVAVDMVKSFPPLNPATYNGIPIESYVVREFDFSY
ncbi:MAG: energy transducer TonB, partial [Salibacteraceae bacterium]